MAIPGVPNLTMGRFCEQFFLRAVVKKSTASRAGAGTRTGEERAVLFARRTETLQLAGGSSPPTNSGDGGEREIGEGFWRRRLAGRNERAIVTGASTSVSIAASRSPAGVTKRKEGGFVVSGSRTYIGGGVSASVGCLRRRENGNATRLILPVVLCLS